jgi:hypothetical protein
MFHVPERYRLMRGRLASDSSHGNNGGFLIPMGTRYISVLASDGAAIDEPRWEHVSVSYKDRCPTWDEMCKIKSLFWDAEDTVMQLHPPESEWINNHPYCLHLFRPVGIEIPRPPGILVGLKVRSR